MSKMSLSFISQLKTLVENGRNKDGIEEYEDVVAERIEKFAKEELFYELPTNELLKIVGKSVIEDPEVLCEVISRVSASKGEESTLLLNVIKREKATIDECIRILSKFKQSPLCQKTCELFNEDKSMPERDYELEISKLWKEIDIITAAETGKLACVQYFVGQCHGDVDTKDDNGRTLINIASANGHLELVKYLYESCHKNVEAKDNKGNTLINIASANGHLDIVKYLYEQCHADVETRDENGCTPLNNASTKGHLNVVKYLCETCHADVETRNNDGSTPLNIASLNGHLDVVKYLCEECHANVEAKGESGRTPLSIASMKGHLDVVEYLFETCHADVKTKDDYGRTPIQTAYTERIRQYLRSKQ